MPCARSRRDRMPSPRGSAPHFRPGPLTASRLSPTYSISLGRASDRTQTKVKTCRKCVSNSGRVVRCHRSIFVADADHHATLGYRPSGRARCKHLAPCRPQPLVDADRVHSAAQPDRLVGLAPSPPLADRRSVIDLADPLPASRRHPMPLTATPMNEEIRRKDSGPVGPAPHHDHRHTAAGWLAASHDRRLRQRRPHPLLPLRPDSQKAR